MTGRYELRLSEAAEILGVHPDTLKRWADAGKVECWRLPVNRERRFRRSDIEALRANPPAPDPDEAAA